MKHWARLALNNISALNHTSWQKGTRYVKNF